MTAATLPAAIETVRRRFLDDPRRDLAPEQLLADLIADELPLLDDTVAAELLDRLSATLLGLGPLDALVRDGAVTDILVNGPGPVWVERSGRLQRTDVVVSGSDIALVVERAFRRNGLAVDRAHPVGDTRLADGARLSVVLPPLAPDGPLVAIRKFSPRSLPLERFGSPEVARRLGAEVRNGRNIVVFGPTGAGKTTLLNSLSTAIDPSQRVVTIEDAAELRFELPHVVRLEGRPHNGDGAGGADLRTLVRAALRLRPDRIVVGEVRGPEALDMIWALATGHRGSLSTCHATTAAGALTRLETFVLLADAALPLPAVRSQVRAAIDVLVGVGRVGGDRRVLSIHEVVPAPDHPTGVSPIYLAEVPR